MKKIILSLVALCFSVTMQSQIKREEIAPLIKKYAPLVKTTKGDESSPTSVDWYVQLCALKERKNNKQIHDILEKGHVTPSILGTYKTKPADGEYFLDPLNDKTTLKGQGYVDGISDTECYVNVVQRSENSLIIQYLFFWAYQGPLIGLDITNIALKTLNVGIHQGDWENIVIYLDKKNNSYKIKQIFFSRHQQDKGRIESADSVEFVNDEMKSDKNGTHPVVYAALNSHASYPHASKTDIPLVDYFIKVPTRLADIVSGNGPVWRCWTNPIYVGTLQNPEPGQGWINFVGRWGATTEAKKAGIEYHGNSPDSPTSGTGFLKQDVTKVPITTTTANGERVASITVDPKPREKKSKSERYSTYFNLTIPGRIKKIEWSLKNVPQQDFTYEIWEKKTLKTDVKQFGPLPGKKPFVTERPTNATNLYVANIKTAKPISNSMQLFINGVEE